jgi:hypothetical protein
MILIGMFDSPFVRRVAVSMKLLGVEFEVPTGRRWLTSTKAADLDGGASDVDEGRSARRSRINSGGQLRCASTASTWSAEPKITGVR